MIEKSLPESDWNSAWQAASRIWIDRIRARLGGEYQVYETANFMILSEAPMRIIKDACRSYEDSLKHTAQWNAETIQQFWTGESWEICGYTFELSYNLAQVLWRKIEADLGAP